MTNYRYCWVFGFACFAISIAGHRFGVIDYGEAKFFATVGTIWAAAALIISEVRNLRPEPPSSTEQGGHDFHRFRQ